MQLFRQAQAPGPARREQSRGDTAGTESALELLLALSSSGTIHHLPQQTNPLTGTMDPPLPALAQTEPAGMFQGSRGEDGEGFPHTQAAP